MRAMPPITTDSFLAPAAAAATHHPGLDLLAQLIERDHRRKLLLLLPCAGGIGLAVAAQPLWLAFILAAGLIGFRVLRR